VSVRPREEKEGSRGGRGTPLAFKGFSPSPEGSTVFGLAQASMKTSSLKTYWSSDKGETGEKKKQSELGVSPQDPVKMGRNRKKLAPGGKKQCHANPVRTVKVG